MSSLSRSSSEIVGLIAAGVKSVGIGDVAFLKQIGLAVRSMRRSSIQARERISNAEFILMAWLSARFSPGVISPPSERNLASFPIGLRLGQSFRKSMPHCARRAGA
jgi:hypothetical protein